MEGEIHYSKDKYPSSLQLLWNETAFIHSESRRTCSVYSTVCWLLERQTSPLGKHFYLFRRWSDCSQCSTDHFAFPEPQYLPLFKANLSCFEAATWISWVHFKSSTIQCTVQNIYGVTNSKDTAGCSLHLFHRLSSNYDRDVSCGVFLISQWESLFFHQKRILHSIRN